MSRTGSPAGRWLGALGARLSGAAGGSAAPADAAGVELAKKPTQPQQIQKSPRNSQESFRAGSSGTGLPSALCTPGRRAAADSCSDDEGQAAAAAAGQQGADEPLPAAAKGQRVRWLPGLLNADAASSPAADAAPGSSIGGVNSSSTTTTPGGSGRKSGRLPPSGDPQLDKYLAYLLREQHPHKFLYYPEWGLSEDGCAAVGEFLRRDRRIRAMTLSGNDISDEGVELIAEGLAANRTLVSLDLSNNAIGNDGAVALAEALHSDTCVLTELQLAQCRIGDEGAEALAAAVSARSSTPLTKLNLAGNPVSATQLQVVAHVLKTREYKMPPEPPGGKGRSSSSSSSSRHLRKASSHLLFELELMEGQALERSSSSSGGGGTRQMRYRDLFHLAPAVAVVALTEHIDPLESSIAMQAAHLLSELHNKEQQPGPAAIAGTAAGSSSASGSAAGGGSGSAGSTDAHARHELLSLLALRLAGRGYEVALRTCWPAQDAGADAADQQQQQSSPAAGRAAQPTGLRHTFVRVKQPAPEHAALQPAVIVDPYFTQQLVIPHATQRYSSVLEALPRVLCVAEPRMWHLIELLSREMAAAFREAGLSLAPWRANLHDEWLSLKHHDLVVDADSSLDALLRAAGGLSLH